MRFSHIMLLGLVAFVIAGFIPKVCIGDGEGPPLEKPAPVIDGVLGKGEYKCAWVFGDGFFALYWHLSGDEIYFLIKAKTRGWAGVGFAPSRGAMLDADIITGYVDNEGNPHIFDHFASGMYEHREDKDSSSIIDFAGTEKDGVTIIEFVRPLSSDDKEDYSFKVPDKVQMFCAVGTSDDITVKHKRVDWGTLIIPPPPTPPAPDAGTENGKEPEEKSDSQKKGLKTPLLPVHVALMLIGFVLAACAASIPAFMKKKKWWLKVHVICGTAGAVFVLAGFFTALVMIRGTGIDYVRSPLMWLGTFTTVLMVVTVIWACLALSWKRFTDFFWWKHRWAAVAALVFLIICIVVGALSTGIL